MVFSGLVALIFVKLWCLYFYQFIFVSLVVLFIISFKCVFLLFCSTFWYFVERFFEIVKTLITEFCVYTIHLSIYFKSIFYI